MVSSPKALYVTISLGRSSPLAVPGSAVTCDLVVGAGCSPKLIVEGLGMGPKRGSLLLKAFCAAPKKLPGTNVVVEPGPVTGGPPKILG